MFLKIKKKHDSIELTDLNNILLVISLVLLIISLLYATNVLILVLIFIFIYELSSHLTENKYIRFLSNFLGILLFGYLSMYFLDLSFINFDIKNVFRIVIKILLLINYFLIVFVDIKRKKLKIIKGRKGKKKKYTFKELRGEKIDYFKTENIKTFDTYTKNNNINLRSDYYKLLKDNLDNKTANDLEEYVWLNYLRFYKNKKYNRRNVFDKMNFVFILIHVIILLLAIFVR